MHSTIPSAFCGANRSDHGAGYDLFVSKSGYGSSISCQVTTSMKAESLTRFKFLHAIAEVVLGRFIVCENMNFGLNNLHRMLV